MKKQIVTILSLIILSTSAFAQSSATACDKKTAPEVLSSYLKGLNEAAATTEAALESGGQKLNAKLTSIVGDDVPAKTSMKISKLEDYIMLANCYNILWGQGTLKPDFKAQKDKKKKIITDNEEYLSMGYPSLEDATSEEDIHHAKVRQLVVENIEAIAFVQAFFDGSRYLEKE